MLMQPTSMTAELELQCLLHMPQIGLALGTWEGTAKVQNSGINWGMCSKHCDPTFQEFCMIASGWQLPY